MKFKPYPEYKESGVEWLGKVPKCWEEKRAKFFFKEIDQRSIDGTEELLSVSHLTGVTPRSEKNVTMFKAESYVGSKICKPDDLVINTMWAWMGALGVTKQFGIVSSSYNVYRPITSEFMSEYIDLLLRTKEYINEYIIRSRGIRSSRLRLYPDQFLDINICCPTMEEQKTIIRFLKFEAKKINRFIRNKKRLIELLKEQKQAIINQAVTKGLDPNAPMKPSGIEWIGDIPEGWSKIRLKNLASIRISGVDKKTNEKEVPVRLCNYLDVYNNEYILPSLSFMQATAKISEIENLRIESGDVIITKDSENWQDIAVPSYVIESQKNLVCGYHLALLKALKNIIIGEYLLYCLLANEINVHFRLNAKGITRYGLSKIAINDALLVIPTIKEQLEIVNFIKREINKTDVIIKKAKIEIGLIQEYRTRLISDAVTGKIDVRDFTINITDEIMEDGIEEIFEENMENHESDTDDQESEFNDITEDEEYGEIEEDEYAAV